MKYLLLIALLFIGCNDSTTTPERGVKPFHLLKIGDSFAERDYNPLEIRDQTVNYIWYQNGSGYHNIIINIRLREVVYGSSSFNSTLNFWYSLKE